MSHHVLESNFSHEFLEELFSTTDLFLKSKKYTNFNGQLIASIFYEPSTRTRSSFEIAAKRIGCNFVHLNIDAYTSSSKGESDQDTLLNLAAMKPDLMILRHSNFKCLSSVLEQINIPVISAGDGKKEHPTQALLDAYTIRHFKTQLKGLKVLMIGDIKNSRVANSNRVLLTKLGAEVSICCPDIFKPNQPEWSDIPHYSHLDEKIKKFDVIMKLRLQKERLGEERDSFSDLRAFVLNPQHFEWSKKDAIFLHPGPKIDGEDFLPEVLNDSRIKILKQVEFGVYLRSALMSMMLEKSK